MMKRWKQTAVLLITLLLLLPLAGCIGRPDYETYVISDMEGEQEANEPGNPFQVQTIFRIPEALGSRMQLLGWLDNAELAGLLPDDDRQKAEPTRGQQILQRLAPPYEAPALLTRIDSASPGMLRLSPDGQWLAGGAGQTLTLTSVQNQEVHRLAVSAESGQEMDTKALRWSANSRYISFIAVENKSKQAWIMRCDVRQKELQAIRIQGNIEINPWASVVLSDDGYSALIDDRTKVVMAKRNGTEFEVQYDHASGGTDSVWVDDDRFLFLAQDGTLFQYDNRNRELSILLEKTGFFSLSPDRKSIAYTQSEKESVFAGKLQGNNIIYQETVYQGIIPAQLIWNGDSGALLIDGSKWYVQSEPNVPIPVPTGAGDAQRQTLIVRFR
ncbi:hypothetical protein PAE9249_04189 [Paenibacillus sp. CECT 9249]|uniref:hypothetical protein n=1 Tax=Paenibacillus sp. CECT 9249 TaxID=2845385 RepID=UPI001E2E6894|nr:hypothetical protein [Paenibacillus sp. CECT 9249]CAH0121657.1 hypothetical protein PAE9249_04189 [Paenibacillus sp. CECT 9249]